MPMYGILFSRLGWCSYLLLGIVTQTIKTNMQDCWYFSRCFSWTLGSLSKCGQLNSFYRYDFGRCFSELAQLIPLHLSRGRSTCYSDRSHDFSVTILRCYKDVFLNRFPVCFNLFVLLFLETPCLVVAVQPCMEWTSIKKKRSFRRPHFCSQ